MTIINRHFRVIPGGGTLAWVGDFKDPHYQAGFKAIQKGTYKDGEK
jgi:hypothetical protein